MFVTLPLLVLAGAGVVVSLRSSEYRHLRSGADPRDAQTLRTAQRRVVHRFDAALLVLAGLIGAAGLLGTAQSWPLTTTAFVVVDDLAAAIAFLVLRQRWSRAYEDAAATAEHHPG
ncbi:MAG TPA: hypothetical protein VHD87_15545 [Acidimicrobiales bacterium]|nr:hypothetical protein [Acidimicrobiales bacterium]